jgi:hypothetical protein
MDRRNTQHQPKQPSTVTRQVKQVLDSRKQVKFLDNNSSNSLTTTPTIFDLSSVAQGNTVYQRIGQSIIAKALKVRALFTIADATQVMRIVIFKWFMSDTSDVPSTGELFDLSGSAAIYNLPFLLYKPSRFKILYDKTITMSTNWQPVQMLEMSIPLNHQVEFDIGANTGRNHVYVWLVSDSSVSTHPVCDLTTQLVYNDTN